MGNDVAAKRQRNDLTYESGGFFFFFLTRVQCHGKREGMFIFTRYVSIVGHDRLVPIAIDRHRINAE